MVEGHSFLNMTVLGLGDMVEGHSFLNMTV